ncbi:hypothetical protein [Rhodococcus artemisiae]|uniref:Uncharacterized protein n=1 Tax=Rhodococcus artemisiae TaxID=714159 RepID=A0ABU7LF82_9NOCA|nr:hypothetical protein [Rhodococcus artemisiae]MEE2060212.1 hypothetical protein [Rhodococcus artemisiae]
MADGMTDKALDRFLHRAIARAGAPNGLRFTERQLYYELCRGMMPAHRLPRRPAFTVPALVPDRLFRGALDRHGTIPGLLESARPLPRGAGRNTTEPDLFDYGLPRLLVCESMQVAAMLRANGVPMESACPVVSAADLPLDPGIAAMLDRAGGATVYVLHDASEKGLDLPARLPALTDIPDGVRVAAIGLIPSQAAPLHLPHALGRAVEVESVNPAVLLRTVHRLVRGIHRTTAPLVDVRGVRRAGFLTWPTA